MEEKDKIKELEEGVIDLFRCLECSEITLDEFVSGMKYFVNNLLYQLQQAKKEKEDIFKDIENLMFIMAISSVVGRVIDLEKFRGELNKLKQKHLNTKGG